MGIMARYVLHAHAPTCTRPVTPDGMTWRVRPSDAKNTPHATGKHITPHTRSPPEGRRVRYPAGVHVPAPQVRASSMPATDRRDTCRHDTGRFPSPRPPLPPSLPRTCSSPFPPSGSMAPSWAAAVIKRWPECYFYAARRGKKTARGTATGGKETPGMWSLPRMRIGDVVTRLHHHVEHHVTEHRRQQHRTDHKDIPHAPVCQHAGQRKSPAAVCPIPRRCRLMRHRPAR